MHSKIVYIYANYLHDFLITILLLHNIKCRVLYKIKYISLCTYQKVYFENKFASTKGFFGLVVFFWDRFIFTLSICCYYYKLTSILLLKHFSCYPLETIQVTQTFHFSSHCQQRRAKAIYLLHYTRNDRKCNWTKWNSNN